MAPPDLARLRLELGTILADLYYDAEAIRRVAAAAQVAPGDVADHPRSRDRWHALLARLDHVGLDLILDAAGKEYPKKLGERFDPLRVAHPDAEGAASVDVELSWGRSAEDRRAWRVLPRAKNAAAQATVRVVTDSSAPPSAPTLVALEGPLFAGRLTPMKALALSQVELGPGLGMWTASIVTSHPGWRTRRIEVTATAGGDTGSARLVSISRSGMVLAVVAIVAALGFVVAWLFPLGLPTAVAGSVGVAIATAVLGVVAPLLLDRVRAGAIPLLLGFDLAIPLALVVVALAVLVPPWTCVIVKDEAGGQETVWRGADLRGGAACLCPADGVSCTCDPPPQPVRGVRVVTRRHKVCPPREWPGLAAAVVEKQGRVLLDTDAECNVVTTRRSFAAAAVFPLPGIEGSLELAHPSGRKLHHRGPPDLSVDIPAPQPGVAETSLTLHFETGELKCVTRGVAADDDLELRPVVLAGARDRPFKVLTVESERAGLTSRWVPAKSSEPADVAWACATSAADGTPVAVALDSVTVPCSTWPDELRFAMVAGARRGATDRVIVCDPAERTSPLTYDDRPARLDGDRLVVDPPPPPVTCIYYPQPQDGVRYRRSPPASVSGTTRLTNTQLVKQTRDHLGNCRQEVRCSPPNVDGCPQ